MSTDQEGAVTTDPTSVDVPAPEVPRHLLRAAFAAFYSHGSPERPDLALTAAVGAVLGALRAPDSVCKTCHHTFREHAEPDACFAIDVAAACNCRGFAVDLPATGAPVPLACVCGHLDVYHQISGKGERTACSTATGHTGTPCGCKRYTEERP